MFKRTASKSLVLTTATPPTIKLWRVSLTNSYATMLFFEIMLSTGTTFWRRLTLTLTLVYCAWVEKITPSPSGTTSVSVTAHHSARGNVLWVRLKVTKDRYEWNSTQQPEAGTDIYKF